MERQAKQQPLNNYRRVKVKERPTEYGTNTLK
jgi:hypothetical protein